MLHNCMSSTIAAPAVSLWMTPLFKLHGYNLVTAEIGTGCDPTLYDEVTIKTGHYPALYDDVIPEHKEVHNIM